LRINKVPKIQPGEIRCPRCFGLDLISSQPRGPIDALMRALGREPYHCRFCEKRIFARVPAVRRPE